MNFNVQAQGMDVCFDPKTHEQLLSFKLVLTASIPQLLSQLLAFQKFDPNNAAAAAGAVATAPQLPLQPLPMQLQPRHAPPPVQPLPMQAPPPMHSAPMLPAAGQAAAAVREPSMQGCMQLQQSQQQQQQQSLPMGGLPTQQFQQQQQQQLQQQHPQRGAG